MKISRFRNAALCAFSATLFALPAEAQPPQKTVVRNNFVSAQAPISGSNVGFVSANKGTGPDGNPVSFIQIDLCSYHPDHEHRYCLFASGYAPPSVLSSSGVELVAVDVANISIFQGGIVDCRSGVCMGPLPIPALSFRGSWKRYRGDFSSDFETAGITRNEIRFPENTITFFRRGVESGYSAEFQGSLGTTSLQTPGGAGGATINFSRGIDIEITRTPKH